MCLELFEKEELVRERRGYRLGIAGSCCGMSGLVEAGGALKSVSDAWADILGTDVALKFGLIHQFGGLFAGAAE